MLNHVTYHLSRDALGYTCLDEIMGLVGFEEIKPDDPFEHGYQVRWFYDTYTSEIPYIHFVADGAAQDLGLGLGHFCVAGLGAEQFERCRRSDYCVRDSGSGRCWLEYDSGRLRIEVRP